MLASDSGYMSTAEVLLKYNAQVEVRDEVSLCESKVLVYALLRVLLCIDAGRMDGPP